MCFALLFTVGCKQINKESSVKRFYEVYQDFEVDGKNTTFNAIVSKMDKDDSTQLREILVEYNDRKSGKWLAKFRNSSGNVVTLYKDGSIK